MKNIGKKIIFFFMIGILVFSLSLFALVGCDMGGSATSSSSNGDTTIDKGTDATQSGDKGSATTQLPDTDNPSTDTPNGDAHSTIGGRETNSTQPGENNGNGGDADPNNNPNEGNIGDTDNNGDDAQSGTDNPNGNSGDSTEENGENGNTPDSGNENDDDIGNGGDTSDDPTPDDPQPEELDFSGLEAKICEVIASSAKYTSVNEILAYSVNGGKLLMLLDMNGGSIIRTYSATIDGDLTTQESINAVTNALNKNCLEKTGNVYKNEISFIKATSDITVDGVTYSKDGIEGDNPFARQCGVENAWMTYVSDPGTQTFANTDTGYGKIVKILIFDNSNNAILKEVVVESFSGITNNQVYENYLQNKFYEKDSQEYTLGDNLKTS